MKAPEHKGHWRLVLIDDRDKEIATILLDDCGGSMRVAVNSVADELALWADDYPEMIGGVPNERSDRQEQ